MLDRWSSEAICLQANEMLERTMVSSVSVKPACSCFSSHGVRVSISYLFLFTLAGAAAAAVPVSMALQRVLGAAAVGGGLWWRWPWEGDRRVMEWEAELRLFQSGNCFSQACLHLVL